MFRTGRRQSVYLRTLATAGALGLHDLPTNPTEPRVSISLQYDAYSSRSGQHTSGTVQIRSVSPALAYASDRSQRTTDKPSSPALCDAQTAFLFLTSRMLFLTSRKSCLAQYQQPESWYWRPPRAILTTHTFPVPEYQASRPRINHLSESDLGHSRKLAQYQQPESWYWLSPGGS
jgi:hypothetical protein